jgi:hypothetical protein
MRYLLVLFFVTFLLSCGEETKQTEESTSSTDTAKSVPDMKAQIPDMFCYSYTKGRDTVKLKVEKFPNVVTGALVYDFFQKDGSRGEIDGVLRGDTLVAEYRFLSEGQSSIRQVVFLIKDSSAIEGYGDLEEKDGKMIFKNISTANFSKGTKLTRVNCPVE